MRMDKNMRYLEDKLDKKKCNFVDDAGNFYILGEFDESISQNIVPNLIKKIAEEEDKPNPQIWFYINSNGDIFSLDFGETNIGDRKLSFILTEISLNSGTSVLSQYLCDKSISCERFVELERIILKRIVESTFEEYYKFISDVNLLFGNFIAKQYEDYIIQIKNIGKKLLCAL